MKYESKIKTIFFVIVFGLMCGCVYGLWNWGAEAGIQSNPDSSTVESPAADGQMASSIAGLLKPDGTLNPGFQRGDKTDGYRLEKTEAGAPRLVQSTACNEWDTQFGLANGTNGTVYAIAAIGSDLYVGGDFSLVGGVNRNNIAKYDTLTNTWSSLGSGGGNGIDGVVNSIVAIGSDLYIGGYYDAINVGGPVVFANGVVKYDTLTNAWSVLGSGGGNGVSNFVSTMSVIGNDLYVGGGFSMVNIGGPTITAQNIARYDTLTNTWSALGSGGGNGVDWFVDALTAIGTDLYVGGGFTTANVGGPAVAANRIAKFDTTSNVWSSLGSGGGNGVPSNVNVMTAIGSDLYVGGEFSWANVGGSIVLAQFIIKYDTLTNTWTALGSNGGFGVNNTISALTAIGSNLYAGGYFTIANFGGPTVMANRVAKYDTLTNTWSALGSGGGNGLSDYVRAFKVIGSNLYVGGNFGAANVGGTAVPGNNVIKFNLATNIWAAIGTSSGGNGVHSSILAMVAIGTDLYVGGNFTTIGGIAANHIARYDTLTGMWSPLGTGGGNGVGFGSALLGNRSSATVRSMAVIGSDLYVNGGFFEVNVGGPMVAAKGIAKFDTLTNTWSALGPGSVVDGYVNTLAAVGSNLYIGGYFTTLNFSGPTVIANGIAKYDTLTDTWSALGSGGGNGVDRKDVHAITAIGIDLYVGGIFTTANFGGPSVAVNRIAKYDTLTNTWSALGYGGGNGVDYAVITLTAIGSDLYVGGNFGTTNLGGPTVIAANIARYNTLTNMWSGLGSGGGSGVSGPVSSMVVIGSDLYIGGLFSIANLYGPLVVTNGVAKFDTVTDTWGAFLDPGGGNGISGGVFTLQAIGKSLFAGGHFGVSGDNKISSNIGRYFINSQPDLTYSASNNVIIGNGLTINPAIGPSDDGNIVSIEVQSQGTFTGTVSVNAAGVVSIGNAGPLGNHTITIRATDNCGATTDASFMLNVNCPTITLGPSALPDGVLSTAYSQTVTASPAGSYIYAVSAGALPPGVSLDSDTGAITGTTTAMGSYNFTIKATDGNNCFGEQAYSIKVGSPYEADVAPRPTGSMTVVVSDWVQVGRFSVGLDTPAFGSEFQRADCAPRDTLGDGMVTVADWVQAGRYSVGLDPLTPVGGPTQPGGSFTPLALLRRAPVRDLPRSLRVINPRLAPGQSSISVPVELTALGGENALSFTLGFDSKMLRFEGYEMGRDAQGQAQVMINSRQLDQGRVGVGLALRPGGRYSAGDREVMRLRFRVIGPVKGVVDVSFVDGPTPLSLVNDRAEALPVQTVGSRPRREGTKRPSHQKQ